MARRHSSPSRQSRPRRKFEWRPVAKPRTIMDPRSRPRTPKPGPLRRGPSAGGPHLPRPSAVADALFTRTCQEVLGLLLRMPGRSLHFNEIVDWAATGKGNTLRELKRLCQAGIVRRYTAGNQVYYVIDHRSPVCADLLRLFSKTVGLGETLRAALWPHARRIVLAFLFGPATQGDDRADIELLVVGRVTRQELEPAIRRASEELGRTVHCRAMPYEQWMRGFELPSSSPQSSSYQAQRPRILLIG